MLSVIFCKRSPNYSFSAMSLPDRTTTTATDQIIVCSISGLSQDALVTWIGPDNVEISDTDTENYVIDQGSFVFGSKAPTLTIKTAMISSLTSGAAYKCQVKSTLYPTYSPEVVKAMTLTLLTFGKTTFFK